MAFQCYKSIVRMLHTQCDMHEFTCMRIRAFDYQILKEQKTNMSGRSHQSYAENGGADRV